MQADGSKRAWHGFCTEAMWLGSDGGMARYRLRLESFLSFLALRRDAFIFQDKDAQQIVTELMADYPQANFKWDVTRSLPSRAICTQYRETDLEFFTRLLAFEGLSWRFEHEQDGVAEVGPGAAGTNASTHSKHQLIIFDAQAIAPDMPSSDELRYACSACDRILRLHQSIFSNAPSAEQCGKYRGQGFELRSDAWGM